MTELRNILYPTDFSVPSKGAFHLACSLARDHGARVVILHIAPPPAYGRDGMALAERDEYDELWDGLHQLQAPDPEVQVIHQLRHGDPLQEILRMAQEIHCDLIVMGTHGRSGVGRLLMGSVAEEVVRRAPCPTLTVKAPLPECFCS